jgi:hypothetical protein
MILKTREVLTGGTGSSVGAAIEQPRKENVIRISLRMAADSMTVAKCIKNFFRTVRQHGPHTFALAELVARKVQTGGHHCPGLLLRKESLSAFKKKQAS